MNIDRKMTCSRIFILLPLITFSFNSLFGQNKNIAMNYNKLTEAEKHVIINKGTEPPFTGEYNDHYQEGTYICRQCDAPLYLSSDKFKSNCGWPSFDDEIEGAVLRKPDADGRRTEILCKNCGGHLGHVFLGEQFTTKNTRHCVNSLSMKFIPKKKTLAQEHETKTAVVAGGCFWGVEYFFQKEKGVISTTVGYTGGNTKNPDYHSVSYKNTNHAEAVRVIFDPKIISYESILKKFFEIHDPTQIDRQGPDIGTQYRSEIFYKNTGQKEIAMKLIGQLEKKGYKIATKVTKLSEFWDAEDYHQDYYKKKKTLPYCHVYTSRF